MAPLSVRYFSLVLVGLMAAVACDMDSSFKEGNNTEPGDQGEPNGGDHNPGEPGEGNGQGGEFQSRLGQGTMGGIGDTRDRWQKAHVTRDGLNYLFMANGWGPGFDTQRVSWEGTSFTVVDMQGSQGSSWEPASYPTVFCGVYSDDQSGACGLPAPVSTVHTLRTGWRWRANGNDGQYNAAYDIWMGNGTTRDSHSGYLMVWLRDPPGQQPAGSVHTYRATVAGVPGTWNIWSGTVHVQGVTLPIVNWVRPVGDDSHELEFDVMDFVRDAQERGINIPGTHILSVAVGFEIWNGPVNNLESVDFYVDVN